MPSDRPAGLSDEPVPRPEQIRPGVKLLVLDAFGVWLPRVAVSGVESAGRQADGTYHDFAVVWVEREGVADSLMPWPYEDVRLPRV